MGKTSIRSNAPIRLPHDGPLYHLHSRQHQQQCNNNNLFPPPSADVTSNDTILIEISQQMALKLLDHHQQKQQQQQQQDDNKCDNSISSLLSSLINATQIKQQLQALQAYRSTLFHQQRRQNQQQQQHQQNPSDNINGNTNKDTATTTTKEHHHQRLALYGILLEWSLSIETPLPLRRAIQSNCTVLLEQQQQQQQKEEEIVSSASNMSLITESVLNSIYNNDQHRHPAFWSDPLYSLLEAFNYKRTHDHIIGNVSVTRKVLEFLVEFANDHIQPVIQQYQQNVQQQEEKQQQQQQQFLVVDKTVTNVIQQGLQWTASVKILLTDGSTTTWEEEETKRLLISIQDCLWLLLSCKATPADSLNILGIVYGRTVLLLRDDDNDDSTSTNDLLKSYLNDNARGSSSLPPLNTIAIIQGLCAAIPLEKIILESGPFFTYFQSQSHQADPGIRLAALKGIQTLVSRSLTWIQSTTSRDGNSETTITVQEVEALQVLTRTTLEIILQAWENPPNRRMANSIPPLFQKLISLMQEMAMIEPQKKDLNNDNDHQQSNNHNTAAFRDLVSRLLAQPANRKGRYKALETLLPIVGPSKMIDMGGTHLMESLLEGIGDRNTNNVGTIADLWAKLLSTLLQEMNEDGGRNGLCPNEASLSGKDDLSVWLNAWIPSLARALLSEVPAQRKQVASFCLPRVLVIVGGRKNRKLAASAFASLLDAIYNASQNPTETSRLEKDEDCAIWAMLEVRRVLVSMIATENLCCTCLTSAGFLLVFTLIRWLDMRK